MSLKPLSQLAHEHFKTLCELLQCNVQTWTFYNVLCIRKSDARFVKIVRLTAAVYACVRQRECAQYVSHVFLQRLTIIARFISFSFHALPLVYTGCRAIFAPWYFCFFLRGFAWSWIRPNYVVVKANLYDETLEFAKS